MIYQNCPFNIVSNASMLFIRIVIPIACILYITSCSTQLNNPGSIGFLGKKFENTSGTSLGKNSFCKDCFSLGQMQLKVRFQTIKLDQTKKELFIKGYTQDYYADYNLSSARIIFGKVTSEDSSDIFYNRRSQYYSDSTGYFEITEKYEIGEIIIVDAIGYLVTYYDLSALPIRKH